MYRFYCNSGSSGAATVSVQETNTEVKKVLPTFPDGGTRAWLVVLGVAALNFAT